MLIRLDETWANEVWGFADKLEYLVGIKYNKEKRCLFVPPWIDTIPSGLKGVDIFCVEDPVHFPSFISPDYRGKIDSSYYEMPKDLLLNAKKRYQINQKISKSVRFNRYFGHSAWSVLPDNIRFYQDKNGKVCLDLTQTDIKEICPYTQGIDKFIMPEREIELNFSRRVARHGFPLITSKPRIKE